MSTALEKMLIFEQEQSPKATSNDAKQRLQESMPASISFSFCALLLLENVDFVREVAAFLYGLWGAT